VCSRLLNRPLQVTVPGQISGAAFVVDVNDSSNFEPDDLTVLNMPRGSESGSGLKSLISDENVERAALASALAALREAEAFAVGTWGPPHPCDMRSERKLEHMRSFWLFNNTALRVIGSGLLLCDILSSSERKDLVSQCMPGSGTDGA
jgi:hypothetical protein